MGLEQMSQEYKKQDEQRYNTNSQCLFDLIRLYTMQSELLQNMWLQVETQEKKEDNLHFYISESLEPKFDEIKEILKELCQDVKCQRNEIKDNKKLEEDNQRNCIKIMELNEQIVKLNNILSVQKREMEKDIVPSKLIDLYKDYQSFLDWSEKIKSKNIEDIFSFICKSNFLSYVHSCALDSTIENIFNYAEKIVQNEDKKEELETIDKLIDSCIDIQSIIYDNHLLRQTVKVGDVYDCTFHWKREQDKAVGNIKKILLRGVVDKEKKILKGCRSFVEVEGEE